ncbi:hypothetical protein [Massilia sp. TN1-12]|uniref:hypothetical protein n=1 Tax=Massilia paldalensis TaxID=3377675 RepID=UPI0038501D86
MTDAQMQALRATMPWTERAYSNGRHTIIQVIDNQGREVPLLTLVPFMTGISHKLATKEKTAETPG